ncbi:MAG: acyltransferase [Anaerolineales bacterium]|nr:MAG: acyltransferase [Anaerolineales bacterium]
MTDNSTADQKVTSKPRLFYIDNLRILLTILVILHHLAIGYGASGNNPYVEAGEISTVSTILMTLFVAINQSFFMGFFFMISSYFSPGSYDRKGAWMYIKDRLKRLGIPLLFYIVVIDPLLSYVLSRYYGFPGSLGEFLSIYLKSYDRLGVGPLWFVAALLIFSLVYALWRLAIKPPASPPPSEGKAPSNLAIAGFALALGLLTFVVRIWMPVGREFELLGFQLAHFVQYIAMFIVGIVAYRRNWFSELTAAQGKVWLRVVLLLLVLFPVLFVAAGALEGDIDKAFGGVHWQSLAYSVWEEFMCLAMVVTLLVWFRTRFNQQGSLAQKMSAAAYATYIFHRPTIILLAIALSSIKLDLALKFVLVAPLAVALSFLVGYAVKRLPIARNIL